MKSAGATNLSLVIALVGTFAAGCSTDNRIVEGVDLSAVAPGVQPKSATMLSESKAIQAVAFLPAPLPVGDSTFAIAPFDRLAAPKPSHADVTPAPKVSVALGAPFKGEQELSVDALVQGVLDR